MKIAKVSHKFPSMTIQTSHARPFTSNDGASYQNNGKIATSKGGGKEHLLYPKIFPLIYQDFPHKTLWTQDKIKVCSTQEIPLH